MALMQCIQNFTIGSQGASSPSFSDGVSATNTSWTSATAAFVAGDVGKSITGTNIPASTTILSVTNGTTIVLSQATTGTGGSLTFVIVNRVIGTDLEVMKGDFYDSAQAVAVAAPNQFVALPNGTTVHRYAGQS